jgi:hypothetical protein
MRGRLDGKVPRSGIANEIAYAAVLASDEGSFILFPASGT